MKRIAKHAIGLSVPNDKNNPDAGARTQYFQPGTEIDVTKDVAAHLDKRGALVPLEPRRRAEPEKPKKPTGKALTAAIVAKIGEFDPGSAEAFNRDGKPAVVQLERALGFDINEAERDAAWEAFQQQNPDLFKTEPAA